MGTVCLTAACAVVALWLTDLITPSAHKFSLALAIIGAVYTVFVATWNYALSTVTLLGALSMYGEAIVFIVLALQAGREIKAAGQRQSAAAE